MDQPQNITWYEDGHYKIHFLHTSEVHHQTTLYGHTSILCVVQCDRAAANFSHQLEIEVGRYTQIPLEERICQLCHQNPKNTMFVIVVSFTKSEGDTIASFFFVLSLLIYLSSFFLCSSNPRITISLPLKDHP